MVELRSRKRPRSEKAVPAAIFELLFSLHQVLFQYRNIFSRDREINILSLNSLALAQAQAQALQTINGEWHRLVL
jgi:hypothetical protein